MIKNQFLSYFQEPHALRYVRSCLMAFFSLSPTLNRMAPCVRPSSSFPRSLHTESLVVSPSLWSYLASLSRSVVDGGARVNAVGRQSFRGLRILCREASWYGVLVIPVFLRRAEWKASGIQFFQLAINQLVSFRRDLEPSGGLENRFTVAVSLVLLVVRSRVLFLFVLPTYVLRDTGCKVMFTPVTSACRFVRPYFSLVSLSRDTVSHHRFT